MLIKHGTSVLSNVVKHGFSSMLHVVSIIISNILNLTNGSYVQFKVMLSGTGIENKDLFTFLLTCRRYDSIAVSFML